MKFFKKLFSISLICFVFMQGVITSYANNDGRVLVYSEQLDNGVICEIYYDASMINSRNRATSYTFYNTLTNEITGDLMCEIRIQVGFSYEQPDGVVKIGDISYSIQYVNTSAGYSVDNFVESYTNGNPAVARLRYDVYKNNSLFFSNTAIANCYNNGTVNHVK